ncbi:Tellurite resistance protein TehB [Clostridium collagenovorans DSM 3089]|uniref:Tellurite resistance protein TehB n=1 Tax=Clostridium collagenovorans DSM 3089 TaxID=1121306 RepID=A0A1M5XSH6_9CLOT|nr:hypothetical protein [Clostridium collagenovorans]SHI02760.1 Tellurite resistance protein TehB [Clostridium collagenovorans DSM 3089]
MRLYVFSEKYDLIIAHGILQFIKKNDRDKFIKYMKANTKHSGYNVIAVFTDTIELPKDLEKHLIGIFKEEEIKSYYDDWEIEMFESYIFEDEHENGLRHSHAINKIVARKI